MVELVFNLLFIGAGLLADVKLYNTQDAELPALGKVTNIMFREEGYNLFNLSTPPSEDGKCKYTGLAVPYERTWEEVVESSGVQTVIPPEPGKLAGYAILINKKTCLGQEPVAMFRVSTRDERGVFFNKGTMQKAYPIVSSQLSSLREDQRPKWLAQVMQTVATQAETNPAASEFLAYTKQAEEAATMRKADSR